MADYRRDRKRVDKAMRRSGVVVVMNKSHVKTPEHVVTTMTAVYEAGFIAEVTFRIDESLLREAMHEMVRIRAECPPDNPFVLGVGSVINPRELESAMDMGFDMIVAPANVMGGYGPGIEFVETARRENVFAAPAVFTPSELNYFLERDDGLEPDAVKVFPARSHGPKGISDLLAPFTRDRHRDRIIMPTGAVDVKTGHEYRDAIAKRGFAPVLGMSAPLQAVVDEQAPGNRDVILRSLDAFKANFKTRENAP